MDKPWIVYYVFEIVNFFRGGHVYYQRLKLNYFSVWLSSVEGKKAEYNGFDELSIAEIQEIMDMPYM